MTCIMFYRNKKKSSAKLIVIYTGVTKTEEREKRKLSIPRWTHRGNLNYVAAFFTFNIKFSISVFQTLVVTFVRFVESNSVYFLFRFKIVEKRLFWAMNSRTIYLMLVELLILTPSGKKYLDVFFIFYYCEP